MMKTKAGKDGPIRAEMTGFMMDRRKFLKATGAAAAATAWIHSDQAHAREILLAAASEPASPESAAHGGAMG